MAGRRFLFLLLGLCVLGIASNAGPALAAQTVRVGLQESGDGMIMTTSVESVKAGKVTFEVTNRSRDITHEFLIAPLKVSLKKVPYDENQGIVKEAELKGVKELGDLEPGKSGKMTLRLKSGKYLLFCNLPGHYKAGMRHVLTVTPKQIAASTRRGLTDGAPRSIQKFRRPSLQ